MSYIIDSTDASFDADVLGRDEVVLVDFWATWCGPCRAIAPTLELLAEEYKDRAKVVKVDVDNNTETAARFGIRSIPTLMVFKNGERLETVVGGRSKADLAALLDKHLA
ncbi:MAG: thioredoxin [Moraxella sp.]|nr:thioredoxin [Moraxella sp.]